MLDHPSRHDAAATVAARRAEMADTAAALRSRLSPDRLISDGASGLQRVAGQTLNGAVGMIERNPAAAAMAVAGLAWLVFGSQTRDAEKPTIEAMTRWEGEGGNPHPAYETPVEEVGLSGQRGGLRDWFSRAALRGTVEDHPVPMALIFAAIGGVLAARLPVSGIEQAMAADAREQLRTQARRLLDEGRDRVETAATDLKDGLREDLQNARQHVAEAIDKVARPSDRVTDRPAG